MSAGPPDAAADGNGLLPHLIRNLSCSLSSLALSLPAGSLPHRHSSALACLLDRLLAAFPPPTPPPPPQQQCQHLDPGNEPFQVPRASRHAFYPNSFLRLDIFRVLFFVADGLRRFFSAIAKNCSSDGAQDVQSSAGFREEVGLLTEGDVYMRDFGSCFERVMAMFRYRKLGTAAEAAMNGMEIDGNDLRKRLMEFTSELQEYLDHLEVSLQKVDTALSSTVELMTNMLHSNQNHTKLSISACLRTLIRSFLYTHEEDFLLAPQLTNSDSHLEDKNLNASSEIVVKQLLNPQGAKIVGLGGGRGIGKTCVASHVECDSRIMAHFPGGVFYVYIGPEPKLTSLQAQLWKQMWRGSICYSPSKSMFKTAEEGNAALTCLAREGLPCLLVLDDVCDVAHLKPFLCFDSADGGRVLVASRAVENVLESLKDDAFMVTLESWDADESFRLFKSIAGCQDAEKTHIVPVLTSVFHGTPRLIEAAASIVYYGEASSITEPSIFSLFKRGVVNSEANGHVIDISPSASGLRSEGEKAPGVSHEEEGRPEQAVMPLGFSADSTDPGHDLFVDALVDVHPYLQECFLDLAAFPKGEWVSLSMILDIWSFGNRMERERAVFILCFLASRSLVEWRAEAGVDNDTDQLFPSCWRLVEFFYELAQSFIEKKFRNASKLSALDTNKKLQIFDKSQKSHANCQREANEILDRLRIVLNNMDMLTRTQCKQTGCFVNREKSKNLHNTHVIDLEIRNGLKFSSNILLQTNYRFFSPGSDWSDHKDPLTDESLASKITKLSLICSNLRKFPANMDFCHLKVVLLSSNTQLKSLPEKPFKCMEHLIVLDLKHCTSLTSLPDSICTLYCLEVLELCCCSGLMSLPQAIGKLTTLKYFDLSGCFSLICLPVSMGSLKDLTTLNLSSCTRLRSLPKTLGNLLCLQMLNISGCCSLQCLPNTLGGLRNLHTFIISGCSSLSYDPPWFDQLINMAEGRVYGTMAVPPQFWKLTQIEVLHLCSLKNLTFLPQSIKNLQHVRHLNLSNSRTLDYLPDEIGSLFLLENLDLSHTAIRKLPPSLGQLRSLVRLCLQGCSRLLCIPPTLCALPKLKCLEMAECWDLVMLPDDFGTAHSLCKLAELDLAGCSIRKLPCFVKGALPVIQSLCLSCCENLSVLPSSFGSLTSLERLDLGGCKSLASLQDVGLGYLKQLQWINLRNCTSLTVIPVFEVLGLQKLKFLDVSGCTKISPFPEPLLQHATQHKFTLIRWGALWR